MPNNDRTLATKLTALDRILAVYDRFCSALDVACQKSCAHCCTANVTVTTLEGYKIVNHLIQAERLDTINGFETVAAARRYQPRISTNRMAELYAAGAKVPQEAAATEWEECPLLTENLCAIYDWRPFGCRCFFSRTHCAQTGYADIDDFTASVNTVFLQTLEHLDEDGCTGNLLDVLQVMVSGDNRWAYEKQALNCGKHGLIENWPLKVLMIPPEHRNRMEPILQQLRNIRLN
jgi:Fe-S-cluster containining protein